MLYVEYLSKNNWNQTSQQKPTEKERKHSITDNIIKKRLSFHHQYLVYKLAHCKNDSSELIFTYRYTTKNILKL